MLNPVKKTSVTVSFILKEPKIHLNKSRTSNETLIVFRVSAGAKIQSRFSTGYKIDPRHWDKKKQRIRNVSAVPNSVIINNDLDKLKNQFDLIITENISKGVPITKELIKSLYNDLSNKNLLKNQEVMTFFKFCDEFIEEKEKSLPKTRGNQSQTVESYKQGISFLKRFSKEENYPLDFDTIDMNFYYEFIEFMQTITYRKGRYYGVNTIGKHIKTLITILNEATYKGYNSSLKYKHPNFKVIKETTKAIYLNTSELQDMFDLDLSKYPNHEKARDIFLLGCETGQRISDYNRFNTCETTKIKGRDFIVVNQKKVNNTVVYCPITDAMKKIINTRYDGKFPSKMNEQYINKYIKEVGEMAKINNNISVEKTEKGAKVKIFVPKYSLIATHTARRSYATNKFKAGVRVHDIMIMTGHKTEKEFLKYIREDGISKAVRITESEEFKKSSLKV